MLHKKLKMKSIYLDYHATTPVLTEAIEAMAPYWQTHFGNPSSNHEWGWKAEGAVLKAKKQVAAFIDCDPQQVYFTSGATESIHWAIIGWLRQHPQGKILTSTTEHKATFGACEWASELGARVVKIPVNQEGIIQLEVVKKELQENVPTLLSLIHANNEIGTINPILEIAALKETYPHLDIHLDACQSLGKLEFSFLNSQVDFLSFSAHKIYGPKGIGALIIRDTKKLTPLFSGGGQQNSLRAGTLNVPLIVALGVCADWFKKNWLEEAQRLKKLSQKLIAGVKTISPKIKLNGSENQRLPHNINMTLYDIHPDKIILALAGVGFSSGSACASTQAEMSHVLEAIGVHYEDAKSTVRFGLGLQTKDEDIDFILEKIKGLYLQQTSLCESQP